VQSVDAVFTRFLGEKKDPLIPHRAVVPWPEEMPSILAHDIKTMEDEVKSKSKQWRELESNLSQMRKWASSQTAKYVGGEVKAEAHLHTHMALAWQGCKWSQDRDFYGLAALQFILGGGKRFGNQGIGKGSVSRLFREVFAKDDDILELTTFNLHYRDSGLFGIFGITEGHASALTDKIVNTLATLRTGGITDTELQRAKNMFKADVLHNSSQPSVVEFLGSQGSWNRGSNNVISPQQYAAGIDSITIDDVHRIVNGLLGSKPSLAVLGDINVASVSDIQHSLIK